MHFHHCHAKNVSSIVLEECNEYGGLTRMFLVWPNHELWKQPDFTVGIHNHKYDLEIKNVLGHAQHHKFTVSKSGLTGNVYKFKRYRFESSINGNSKIEFEKEETLSRTTIRPLYHYFEKLRSDELHTITVPMNEYAAWIVKELDTKSDYTTLYTNNEINTDGLYERINDNHVNNFVGNFFRRALLQ